MRGVKVMILAALVALAASVASIPEPGTAAPARKAASLSITGHGYGHGHGMSQWGAYYRASAGKSVGQILNFYYPGTQRGTQGGNVKVLISADTSTDVVVRDRSGLRVRSVASKDTYLLDRAAARKWRLTPASNGNKTQLWWRGKTGTWQRARMLAGQAEFTATGAPITLITPAGARAYRGVLRSAAPSATSSTRDTVNIVSLEHYLRGVVPREVPASWPAVAVQAQAVAARTYASFEKRHPLARHYQICDTTACQVYGGYTDEHPDSNKAIDATKKRVVLYQGQAAFTQFSASNGGAMSAGSRPYLVNGKDTFDTAYRNWNATVTAAALERAFPGNGTFQGATIAVRDGNGAFGGRVLKIRLNFSGGHVVVSGDTFRSYFGLRSTLFALK